MGAHSAFVRRRCLTTLRRSRVVRIGDLVATFGSAGLVKVRGLVAAALMVRFYGADGYGAYVLGLTVAQIFAILSTMGLGTALVLHWPDLPITRRRRLVVWLSAGALGAAGVLTVGWAILLSATSLFLDGTALRRLALLASLTVVPAVAVGIFSNVFRAQGHVRAFAIGNAGRAVVEVAVLAASVLFGLSVSEFALASLATQAVLALVYSGRAFSELAHDTDVRAEEDGMHLRTVLRTSTSLGSVAVAQEVVDRSDRLVIASFLDARAVGVYSAAYALASLIYGLIPPFTAAVLPGIRDRWRENSISAYRELRRLLFVFVLFVSLVGSLLLTFRVAAIRAVLGTEIVLDLLDVLPVLIGAALIYVASRLLYLPMMLGGAASRYSSAVWWSAGSNLILAVFLTPVLGIVGAALASLLSYVVLGSIALVRVPKMQRRDALVRSVPLAVVAAFALASAYAHLV